jgi:acyl-coenzyme A thioesterase PaaI-like protein
MLQSLKTRILRRLYNLWPCYWGTRVHIKFISKDFREIRIELPLNWRTRNYVGTIFGGSIYGAVDPLHMLMLMKNLGSVYEIWDEGATIWFRKPGRSTLHAQCMLEDEEIRQIRELAIESPVDRVYLIDLADHEGTICATIEKTIHIRRRRIAPSVNQ